jgi:hypothetical protein
VRYRAKAHICNGCPRKANCTDSDHGREIVRSLNPWPHSEAGRFHRTLAVLLVAVSLLVLVVGAARNYAPPEAALLAALAVAGVALGRWLLRDLRATPANFPDPGAAHGLRMAMTGADGRRAPSRWASQN